jgi:hypothetical protein
MFYITLEPEFHKGFQWQQSHLKIPSESTGIIETSGRPESARVLRHHLLGRWPVYLVGAR